MTILAKNLVDEPEPPRVGGVFFRPRTDLPRGRHALDRDDAIAVYRERAMASFTELVAAHGLADVAVGDVVAHARMSRSAFYASFADLSACGDAAYERFISVLVGRLTTAMDPSKQFDEYVRDAVHAYLGTLQADLVVARAMQLELDAGGRPARLRRRAALGQIGRLFADRYDVLRQEDPSVGPLPIQAHVGFVYAVRQLACDMLDREPEPDLLGLVDPLTDWITTTVAGATARS